MEQRLSFVTLAVRDLALQQLHARAVGRRRRGLHRARALRLRLLRVLVHEPVEEVRERVEREVRRRGDGPPGQQLTRVQRDRGVVVVQEGELGPR